MVWSNLRTERSVNKRGTYIGHDGNTSLKLTTVVVVVVVVGFYLLMRVGGVYYYSVPPLA